MVDPTTLYLVCLHRKFDFEEYVGHMHREQMATKCAQVDNF